MKTRHTIILVFSILFTVNLISQNNKVELSLQQDIKLCAYGDHRGNGPLTLDILSRLEVPFYSFEKSHFSAIASFEFADLHQSNYQRYAVGVGYIIDKLTGRFGIGAFVDYGKIYRECTDKNFNSFSANAELSFKLSKRWKIIASSQFTHRTDLVGLYNCDKPYRTSGFLGLKYAF